MYLGLFIPINKMVLEGTRSKRAIGGDFKLLPNIFSSGYLPTAYQVTTKSPLSMIATKNIDIKYPKPSLNVIKRWL